MIQHIKSEGLGNDLYIEVDMYDNGNVTVWLLDSKKNKVVDSINIRKDTKELHAWSIKNNKIVTLKE